MTTIKIINALLHNAKAYDGVLQSVYETEYTMEKIKRRQLYTLNGELQSSVIDIYFSNIWLTFEFNTFVGEVIEEFIENVCGILDLEENPPKR